MVVIASTTKQGCDHEINDTAFTHIYHLASASPRLIHRGVRLALFSSYMITNSPYTEAKRLNHLVQPSRGRGKNICWGTQLSKFKSPPSNNDAKNLPSSEFDRRSKMRLK